VKPKVTRSWHPWFFHESMAHLRKVDTELFYRVGYGGLEKDFFLMYQMGNEL